MNSECEAFLAELQIYGHTDADFLRVHWQRFQDTLALYRSGTPAPTGARVLDVGGHWLHQALLWRKAGYRLCSIDLPAAFAEPTVRALARAQDIELLSCRDLRRPVELQSLPKASFDVLLFTEILEHLPFNHRPMWNALLDCLKPGATIVLTTPNHYALRGRAWRFDRFLRGHGSGLRVDEILDTDDTAHHWKEYSARELRAYVERLGAPCRVQRLCHFASAGPSRRGALLRRGAQAIERLLPGLRGNLYLEIRLDAPAPV